MIRFSWEQKWGKIHTVNFNIIQGICAQLFNSALIYKPLIYLSISPPQLNGKRICFNKNKKKSVEHRKKDRKEKKPSTLCINDSANSNQLCLEKFCAKFS